MIVKLSEIYNSVENPLNDEELLKRIVSEYANSSRTNLICISSLYDSLVTMNQTKDNTEINLDDKEQFLVETYNQWINNILRLNYNQLKDLEEQKVMKNAKAVKQYLQSFGKVSSMADISIIKSNPVFIAQSNTWQLNDGWEHIKSQYISVMQESEISEKHRLYVGCQNQDMWKLARLFKGKCDEQQIPFHFKLGSSSNRDDKMVIYADTDNLANYISALREIAQEYPDIIDRCGQPPVLTGKIDNWIGIGDEPPLQANGNNQSYHSIRANIFESAIEEALLADIKEFKGKEVLFNGKQVKFNELFKEQATQIILATLEKYNVGREALSNYGLEDEDLKNGEFKEYIKTHLGKTIQSGLKRLDEVKDKKEEEADYCIPIFFIPTRNEKKIGVNIYDMDRIIKSMIPIIKQIDLNFMNKVKTQIIERCHQSGIDDNFCFQRGTKEKFEKADNRETKNKVTQEQQKYNRDINALIGAMNVVNNGTMEVGILNKAVREQSLEQEVGIMQSNGVQIEQEEKEFDRKTQTESMILTQETKKKLQMCNIIDTILKSKITMSETQSAMENMKKINEIKRIMFDKRMGKQLTAEQELLIQSHIRQTNEMQIRYQKQQNPKKGNRLEI